MKKTTVILIALITICISLGVVFADDSDSKVSFADGKLTILDIDFNIPDGYTQDDASTQNGVPANLTGSKDGKQYAAKFTTSDGKEIIVKVVSSDTMQFTSYTPEGDYTNKTIAGKEGFLQTYAGDNTPYFTYIDDGKLIQIWAPDEATIESIIK